MLDNPALFINKIMLLGEASDDKGKSDGAVQIVSKPPAHNNGARFTVSLASRPYGSARWLVLLFIKAGDVEMNPGLTTTRIQLRIYDICHRQIRGIKQISIRCHWIEY